MVTNSLWLRATEVEINRVAMVLGQLCGGQKGLWVISRKLHDQRPVAGVGLDEKEALVRRQAQELARYNHWRVGEVGPMLAHEEPERQLRVPHLQHVSPPPASCFQWKPLFAVRVGRSRNLRRRQANVVGLIRRSGAGGWRACTRVWIHTMGAHTCLGRPTAPHHAQARSEWSFLVA